MSGSATVQASPPKRSRRSNDSGSAAISSSAATPDAAGNTKKVVTISPLSAALVLKVTFIKSLPNASRPFLTLLAESALHEFACLFYAEEKVKETKSNPNYVSSSAKPCLKYKRARVSRLSVMNYPWTLKISEQ
jgi:hypothetical protein